MKTSKNILASPLSFAQLTRLQAAQFVKRKGNFAVLFIFLCAGFYALYQGYVDKKAKTATIQAFRQEKDSLLRDLKTGIAADTTTKKGMALYQKSSSLNSGLWNTRLPSYKLPVSTAIYNIGQSDVFTYYYIFSAENFEMQLLKQTEITNPLRALAGHFDVSFWIIYLLPLLILLLCFNALSSETDNGNWRLIAAQGISEKQWLQSKLAVAGIYSLLLIISIAIAGIIINDTVFKQAPAFSDVVFFFTAIVYLAFWFSAFYFINSWRRPTAFNALVSGIVWISFCLVVPVIMSKLAAMFIPIDNTQISTFSRRPQDTRIESDKSFAAGFIKKLGAQDIRYKEANIDTAKPAFNLRTYHALHQLLHMERWPVIQHYFNEVEKRQQFTNWSAIINPASSTDGYLTAVADNDAASFHRFTAQTERLHAGLHNAFYPSLYSDKPFSKKEYKALPVYTYQRSNIPMSIVFYYLLIIALIGLLMGTANRRLKSIQE